MNVTTITDLWRMSATDLAEAIRSKRATSQEVIEAHLRRIEADVAVGGIATHCRRFPLNAPQRTRHRRADSSE